MASDSNNSVEVYPVTVPPDGMTFEHVSTNVSRADAGASDTLRVTWSNEFVGNDSIVCFGIVVRCLQMFRLSRDVGAHTSIISRNPVELK